MGVFKRNSERECVSKRVRVCTKEKERERD